MGKMTLDVSALKVESFTASQDNAAALMDCTENANCTTPCIAPTCEDYFC